MKSRYQNLFILQNILEWSEKSNPAADQISVFLKTGGGCNLKDKQRVFSYIFNWGCHLRDKQIVYKYYLGEFKRSWRLNFKRKNVFDRISKIDFQWPIKEQQCEKNDLFKIEKWTKTSSGRQYADPNNKSTKTWFPLRIRLIGKRPKWSHSHNTRGGFWHFFHSFFDNSDLFRITFDRPCLLRKIIRSRRQIAVCENSKSRKKICYFFDAQDQ